MVLPFGWSLFYRGSLKARRKEGPRGVAFELNRSFKISWSIELDGGKESFGRWTFQRKQLTWAKA